ncbi:hypothetical protein BaRGS_00005255 [Batillaria attramentaria]|uniref:Uncharacterized protein n=1 Tax=Batillaria attramentaria TaxID=370345 RepID=A0ABD0LWC2_9CAEN
MEHDYEMGTKGMTPPPDTPGLKLKRLHSSRLGYGDTSTWGGGHSWCIAGKETCPASTRNTGVVDTYVLAEDRGRFKHTFSQVSLRNWSVCVAGELSAMSSSLNTESERKLPRKSDQERFRAVATKHNFQKLESLEAPKQNLSRYPG